MKNALGVLVLAAGVMAGCSKDANGNLIVKTPKIVTETDTVKTPVVEKKLDTITTVTPKIEVRKETSTVVVSHPVVSKKP